MGPSKELRGLQRCYYKSGPINKTRGPLMSLTNKALPEEQRLPLTMTKTDLKRSSPKGPPMLRQPQSLKPLKSLRTLQNLKMPQNFEPSQSLHEEPLSSFRVGPPS